MVKISIYSRPPEESSKLIRSKIKEISKIFGKNRASKSPLPHLTIRSSLNVSKKEFPGFCRKLREEFRKMKKPIIEIGEWASAPKNLDVYGFHLVVKNNKKLKNIHKKLERLFPKYKKTYIIKKFAPHISLAWEMKSKMKKEQFENTLNYLKKEKFSFNKKYVFDKLYLHEEVGKNKYRFIKMIK